LYLPARQLRQPFRQLYSTVVSPLSIGDQMPVMRPPNKEQFSAFFDNATKTLDLTQEREGADNVISLQQLLLYEDVAVLLRDGFVDMEDVQDLWTSSAGEAKGLSMEEAFEFACMVTDLPDPGESC